MILLKVLFFIFIIIIITGIFTLFRIFNHLHNVADEFKRQMNGGEKQQNSQHTSSKEETITDHRSPNDASKKIFTKEDGEYVDYQETK